MDPFEMLIRASAIDESNNNNINNSYYNNNTISFDYRNYLQDPMLGPIDSIMMLADQASQQSPIHKASGGTSNQEEDAHFSISMGSFERRKSRAMSEPWIQSDTWSTDRAKSFLSLGSSSSSSSSTSTMKRSGREGNIEFTASSSSSSHTRYNHLRSGTMSSADLLYQYSDIYNKFGRVGIYTKDERNAIISRFREKKKTRIWKKKIRYTCRKSLADRRVRVKGRFVKTMPGSSMSDERVKGEGQGRPSDRGGGELRPGIYRAKDEDDDDFYMEEEEEDEEDGEYRNDIINGNVEEDDDDGYLELIDDNAASAALSLLSGSKELMFGTDLDHADDDDRYGYHDDDGGRGIVSNTLSSSSALSSSSISSSPMQFSSNSSNNRYHNDSIHTTSTIVTGRNGYNTRKAIVEVKGLLTPPPPLSFNRAVETIATLPPQKSKKVQQDTVVRSKRIRRHSIAY